MSTAGFFALDRGALRQAREELGGGATFGFFLDLSVDAKNGVLNEGCARELAAYFGYSVRATETMLNKLHELGWIVWTKPTNQWSDGSVRILRDLERVKAPRRACRAAEMPTTEPTEAPAETAQVPTAEPTGAPDDSGEVPTAELSGAPTEAESCPGQCLDGASTVPTAEPTGASRDDDPHLEPRTKNLLRAAPDAIDTCALPGFALDAASPHARAPDDGFEEFWRTYPRKVGKPQARKAWSKLNGHREAVVPGLVPWARYWSERAEPQFIPHPATWLNREGWNDEPPPLPSERPSASLTVVTTSGGVEQVPTSGVDPEVVARYYKERGL